ncbi:bifunctional acetate--CoA ligase family protein/GNAT family N-acetyltransferase [Gimesia fumaroli]|uniref:Succinyl-CoA ligase [ADP-forming] subunit alpha n=1 Tax=Gimesia fumaroli TaxID=2527976 RepID=A0A518I4I6_9PLAN|nr:bifunctional acetate--CoA ligase family protein/GNAT family N-acetyltransferase [Gimesia fumaroli]QDV48014.1 Succinyl-CoA ligase [ADP-forming] subunit alpha [Gimesia fumaroli]
MPIRNLNKIFHPRKIAVIGASPRPLSVGQTVFQNLFTGGFEGAVYPVNPKYDRLDDQVCYNRVTDLPETVDLAVICTPAHTIPEIIQQCGEAGIRGIVILSAGFRESGDAGKELEQQVLKIARTFPGMRIVGPNCLGVMAPYARLNASFASDMPLSGNVAFISQSGALCTSVLDWSLQEKIGFSHFVSVGNMLDVGIADLIDYFALDHHTTAIILYIESITEARQFMSAARAFTKKKPIIAYKAGRFTESAKAAASHTGAMAGVDAVYEAAFARAGVVRVFELDDLFDCAELLARQKCPKGDRLAIVTNAGGPGVMATDALLARQGVLATFSDETIEKLSAVLPSAWSHGNPLDLLGDAPPERFGKAVEIVLADPQVDGLLVILSPQAMTDPPGAATAVIEATRATQKPVLTAWMGGEKVRAGIERFNNAGIPTYTSPEQAVRAFMYLVSYARNREFLYETPHPMPVDDSVDRAGIRAVFESAITEGQDILSESTSKKMLAGYGIPITKTEVARTADEAVAFAQEMGQPVVLKVFSEQITHKTDVGGVELDLANETEIRDAFARILSRVQEKRPEAQVEGVTVQPMVSDSEGHELIVGAKRDPVFGMVLLVGAGGTAAELYRDRALVLPPLNERQARGALESLRSWPLLKGYRGHPAVDMEQLIEVLIRLSYFVSDFPEIVELDVNPLLATPEKVIALDARIVIDQTDSKKPLRPYSHLAIRPYPEEFIKSVTLKDGTAVLLRPIKPEDELMWHDLLGKCSSASIHARFRYSFQATTHDMATRFCFVDYDREIAIVAEIQDQDQRQLIGVGRLVADVDHQEAEYAVLVEDHWHGRGLGSFLTDHCLEVCREWGIQRVVAETAPDNRIMLDMFHKREFQKDGTDQSDSVLLVKELKK